jgi:putative nucleotidyltransferase with HDIG domain
MDFYRSDKITKAEIEKKFAEEGMINLECFLLNFEEEHFILDTLKICLSKLEKDNLYEYLSYCFREILNNVKKANTKRVYFEELGLDINNNTHYKEGMKSFKSVTFDQIDKYVKLQVDKGYYIRTSFRVENDNFIMEARGKIKICEEEMAIISNKKNRAKEFKSVDDALSVILNNEEGAGLGIIISILMLKKIGLTSDNYRVVSAGNETISGIDVPFSLITEENVLVVSEMLMREINELPQFPEHIVELQQKLAEPDIDIKMISMLISRDPGLTAEILRFSNSAIYSLPRKISSLLEAIKIIGLRGIRDFVYSYETRKILGDKYDMKKMQNIWDHSYRVGFYAFYFAKKYMHREDLEDIYIGGILHDLGKILTFSINVDLMEKINSLCHEKGIPIRIIEEITGGYNHAMIGAMVAKKWNFPDKFVAAIEYHLNPFGGDNKFRKSIFCIYFANIMSHDEEISQETYSAIDPEILSFFNISSIDDFRNVSRELDKSFNEQKFGLFS